jgi:hypothetical protein
MNSKANGLFKITSSAFIKIFAESCELLYCSASSGLKPAELDTLRMNGGAVYKRADSKTVLPVRPKRGRGHITLQGANIDTGYNRSTVFSREFSISI